MNLTRMFAENIVNTKYEVLPKEVVEKTKRQILDILGVMFPPSTLERGCIALEEIAREGGGNPESTFIGFGGKGPCWMAAFVNGSLVHPLDYEDTLDEFVSHPSAQTFPAAFAVAEKVGNVSGKEFITAVALGIDLVVRLSTGPKGSLLEDYPWCPITVFGVFSATAVAGKVFGLTADEMVNAFGIASDRASGINESLNSPDSEIRGIREGFANREGVFAALMAKKGITACREGIEKFYKFFYKDDYGFSSVTSNLGKEFAGLKVSVKPWPAARATHTYIKAGLDIAREHNLAPDKIQEVIVTVGRFGRDAMCTPPEAKQKPKLSINAKISLPFVMGVVFSKRKVTIEDFLPENLVDPEVLEIASKVKHIFDPHLSKAGIGPAVVEVRTKDGRSFSKRENIAYGHPENPMSDKELMAKFKDCTRYAKKTLSEGEINNLAEKILELEMVKNIKEITQILE